MSFLSKQLYKMTNSDNENVEKSVNVGAFENGLATVHHKLRVFACKNDEPVAPLRVAEDTTTHQNFLVVQRIVVVLQPQYTFEAIEIVVGRFAGYLP
jgi:ATP-dependent helicase/DNAse subunit B